MPAGWVSLAAELARQLLGVCKLGFMPEQSLSPQGHRPLRPLPAERLQPWAGSAVPAAPCCKKRFVLCAPDTREISRLPRTVLGGAKFRLDFSHIYKIKI